MNNGNVHLQQTPFVSGQATKPMALKMLLTPGIRDNRTLAQVLPRNYFLSA